MKAPVLGLLLFSEVGVCAKQAKNKIMLII